MPHLRPSQFVNIFVGWRAIRLSELTLNSEASADEYQANPFTT